MKQFLTIILALLVIISCKKDEVDQEAVDEQIILDYLAEHDIEAVKHSTGLYYNMIVEGSGGHPTISRTVLVEYKGSLTNGIVFDESTGSVELTMGGLIYGMQVGLNLMSPGGKAQLFLPSNMAYGPKPPAGIPPNAVLIFEVTLVDYF